MMHEAFLGSCNYARPLPSRRARDLSQILLIVHLFIFVLHCDPVCYHA